MKKELEELFDQLTPVEQNFIISVINGEKRVDAWLSATGSKDVKRTSATTSSFMLFHKAEVKAFYSAFIQDLMADATISKQKFIARLELMFMNQLPDEKVNVGNQLRAAAQLAQLHGWNAPQIVEVNDKKEKHYSPIQAASAFKQKVIEDNDGSTTTH